MPKPASTPIPPPAGPPRAGPGTPARPGGHSAGAPPDPVPNSAVKHRRAHGTASQDAGERVADAADGRPGHRPAKGRGEEAGDHHGSATPRPHEMHGSHGP